MICPSRRKRLVPTKCFGNSPVRKAGPKLQNVILNAPDINNYDVPSHGQNIHCPAQTRFGKALSLLQSHRGLRFQVLRRHLQQMGVKVIQLPALPQLNRRLYKTILAAPRSDLVLDAPL